MINDYFDLEGGVDTDEYVRALYAPHPILSGWVTKRAARARRSCSPTRSTSRSCCSSPRQRGPLVIAFALGGLFICVFYVAPPIRLKHIGLGEPGVFIVWGPLMVVGTFFVATGALPGWVWIASLPYAILVTTVLFGKHIDKIDGRHGEGHPHPAGHPGRAARPARRAGPDDRLLPDRASARRSSAGSGRGWRSWCSGIPRLLEVLRVFSSPRPETPPHSYVGWPLWFVGAAFVHTRRAGGLLILGLFLNAILPITCPGWGSRPQLAGCMATEAGAAATSVRADHIVSAWRARVTET